MRLDSTKEKTLQQEQRELVSDTERQVRQHHHLECILPSKGNIHRGKLLFFGEKAMLMMMMKRQEQYLEFRLWLRRMWVSWIESYLDRRKQSS